MNIIATTTKPFTKEEKDAIGQIWATDDNGITYWFASLNDALSWMRQYDQDTFSAIVLSMLHRENQAHDDPL